MKVKLLVMSLLVVFAWACQPQPQKSAEPAKTEAPPAVTQPAEPTQPAGAKEEKKEEAKLAEAAKPEEKPAEVAKPEEKAAEKPAQAAKPEEKPAEKPAQVAKPEEKPAGTVGEPNPTGKKVELQFYVMSQCPFGTQVMNGISPVLRKIGAWIDFKMDYIGNIQGDTLTSMHGDSEVKGDIIELCAMKYLGENYKYMDLLDCMNKNMRGIPDNWKGCATEIGLAPEVVTSLKTCFEGDEGKGLLKASFEKAQKAGARGSPTMYLAGNPYRGGRGENDFMRAICNAIQGEKPKACSEIPPPVEFEAIVLADARCTERECDPSRFIGSFSSMFPGMKLRKLDWADEECKKLYEEEGLEYLPAFLFAPEIEKAEGYSRLQRFLRPSKTGKWKVFAGRSSHNPKGEICDNKVDDNGDGKVDCEDETCKQKMVCREEVPGKLELFMMSQCPFGVKAANAMEEVLAAFGTDLKFEIHFIGDVVNGKPTSMHGPGEVDEDIRELCAIKKFPDKFMNYILCRNKNIRDPNWQACATPETGIDAKVIEECFAGEGPALLVEDMKIATALNINASPTWVANGRYRFSGIDAETVRRNICQHNPGFAGCSKSLSSDSGASAGRRGQ